MTGSPFLLGYECLPPVNQARLLAGGIPEYYLTAADTQYNQPLEKKITVELIHETMKHNLHLAN